MKKAYAKPVITFEDFAFSSNVAGECSAPNIHTEQAGCIAFAGNFGTPQDCYFFDNSFSIFNQGVCDFGPDDNNPFNLCYNVNTAANKIFKS